MTYEKILKALAKQGYKSDKPDAASVKAFLADKAIELVDKEGNPVDIDAAFKSYKPADKSPKAVPVEDDEDAGDDKESDAVTAARLIIKEFQKHGRGGERPDDAEKPQMFSIGDLERKSFNARAARGETAMNDADMAELLGAWSRLALYEQKGVKSYSQRKNDEAICTKANVTYDFGSGGFTMPTILRDGLVWIRDKYSIIDMILPAIPIDAAGESFMRSTSEVTVYSPGEGVAMTESNPTGDQFKLVPYELIAYSTASRRLLAGSAMNWGDRFAQTFTYALNKTEERNIFLGDGTSTYFNRQGFIGKFSKLVTDAGGTWTTNAEYAAACVRASGNAWSEITDSDFDNLLASVGDIEDATYDNMPFVVNRSFYYSVIHRLMKSKGGVTMMEMANGLKVPTYAGHPVLFSNSFPRIEANGSVVAMFGNFQSAAKRGHVPELCSFSSNENVAWTSNKVAWKMTAHKAITVHDVGNANSTAASRTAGPVGFLITAES